jgi:hypothetical protein
VPAVALLILTVLTSDQRHVDRDWSLPRLLAWLLDIGTGTMPEVAGIGLTGCSTLDGFAVSTVAGLIMHGLPCRWFETEDDGKRSIIVGNVLHRRSSPPHGTGSGPSTSPPSEPSNSDLTRPRRLTCSRASGGLGDERPDDSTACHRRRSRRSGAAANPTSCCIATGQGSNTSRRGDRILRPDPVEEKIINVEVANLAAAGSVCVAGRQRCRDQKGNALIGQSTVRTQATPLQTRKVVRRL